MSQTGTTASATSFSQLWDELKTEALNVWSAIKGDAKALETKIVPIVESDVTTVLSQLKSVAVNMVMTLASQEFANLTGTQKNKITVSTIVQAAIAAGKPLVEQDAQMLAQQAYHAVVQAVGGASSASQ